MEATIENRLVQANFFQFEGSTAGNNLKGRTRRIFTGNNLVIHRVIGIIINGVPIFRGNAMHKPVGVITRTADHRPYRAIARVDGYYRRCSRSGSNTGAAQKSKMLIGKSFQLLLQLVIYRQLQIFAGNRLHGIVMLDNVTGNVNLLHKGAILTAKIFIISLFQSGLTDKTALSNILEQALLNFIGTYLAYVTQSMYSKLMIRVIADRLHGKHNLRHIAALFLYFRYHLLIKIIFQHNRFIKIFASLNFSVNFFYRHLQQIAEALQCFRFIAGLLLQYYGITGQIVYQLFAFTIINNSTGSKNTRLAQPVAVRLLGVVITAPQLQINHSSQQHSK